MLLPLMGLLMFFVPMAGLVAGTVLLFIRPLRFLAPFVFLMPAFSSYAALAGLWGAGIGLERMGYPERIAGIGAMVGLVIGGLLGAGAGFGVAVAGTRAVHQLKSRR